MSLTPPADAPLPYSVDGGWNGAVRDATGRLLMRGWYRVNLPALKHLVACANAAPALVSRADALATECDALIDGIRTLESARDTALARVAELEAQNSRLRSTLEGIAERDCEYYDNCPSNARHYVCDVCRATRTLDKETP